jgi:hypothetical protein
MAVSEPTAGLIIREGTKSLTEEEGWSMVV